MSQDIQIQLRDSKIIKADLDISDTAQIEAVTISGQKFYAQPTGFAEILKLLKEAGINVDNWSQVPIGEIFKTIGTIIKILKAMGVL